ncbi:MAG: hypothetical protein VB108_01355 [Anaerolineaceae bacterium]|nr:hypothetical protein [Anaerolineaceae bacterium]
MANEYLKTILQEIYDASKTGNEIDSINRRYTEPNLEPALKYLKVNGFIKTRLAKYITESDEDILPVGLTEKGKRYLEDL